MINRFSLFSLLSISLLVIRWNLRAERNEILFLLKNIWCQILISMKNYKTVPIIWIYRRTMITGDSSIITISTEIERTGLQCVESKITNFFFHNAKCGWNFRTMQARRNYGVSAIYNFLTSSDYAQRDQTLGFDVQVDVCKKFSADCIPHIFVLF